VLAARLGIRSPLERLWQKNFHSPHVTYFNDDNLPMIVLPLGFRPIAKRRLPTIRLRGLWNRLTMDSGQSRLSATFLYALIGLSYPLLRHLPSDIILHVFEKTAGDRRHTSCP
jgi:hypothetical protein